MTDETIDRAGGQRMVGGREAGRANRRDAAEDRQHAKTDRDASRADRMALSRDIEDLKEPKTADPQGNL